MEEEGEDDVRGRRHWRLLGRRFFSHVVFGGLVFSPPVVVRTARLVSPPLYLLLSLVHCLSVMLFHSLALFPPPPPPPPKAF